MPRFTMKTRDAKRAISVFWGHRSLKTQQRFRDALQDAQGRGLGEVYFVVHEGRVATAWAFDRNALSNDIANRADPADMFDNGSRIEGNNKPQDMLLEFKDFESVVVADHKDYGDLIHIPSLVIPEGQEGGGGGGGPPRGHWADEDGAAHGGGGGASEENEKEGSPAEDPAIGEGQEQDRQQQEEQRRQEERDRQATEEENRRQEAEAEARREEAERRQEELERAEREGEGRP